MSTDPSARAQHAWVAPLLERYRRVVSAGAAGATSVRTASGSVAGAADPERVEAYNTLRLADALLDKAQLAEQHPDHPVQITLLGPTQSGKSTLTNVLLDTDAAGVSALAGYTVHATGLAKDCDERELQALADVMAPLERVSRHSLDPEALDTFVLESVPTGPNSLLARAVVWDTPDFDSVEAGGYRGAVLQGAAIADVLVLVVSKDKYGDRTVWDMLDVLHTMGRPLVVCLNKLDASDEATVLRAFTERYTERFDTPLPPIVPLPFVRREQREADTTPVLPDTVRRELASVIDSAVSQVDRPQQWQAAQRFIAERRAGWLAPLDHELAARAEWAQYVAAAVDEAEQHYVRRYLDDPRKYDTFNRALAELLTLLELPGVARALARTRELVTWPARTLFGIGRRQLGVEPGAAPDQEAEVLDEIRERLFTRLQGELLERREDSDEQGAWWRAAHAAFRAQRAPLGDAFQRQSETVREAFEPRIEAAAQRLYDQLTTQPALLNSLRAARVTTDAAGVALAVKSGGLAPADLILAPAMLSVTTLLTESALGRYLDSIKSELQAEQRKIVRRELLDGVLGESLIRMADALDDDSLLSGGMDMDWLKGASASPGD